MGVYDVVDPTAIGLDGDRLAELVLRAGREVDEGLLPSCQIAVARHGRLGLFTTLGDAEPGSRYTVFSCTKGLVAGAVYQLLADGSLKTDQAVADVIGEFATNGKEGVTVEMLLTHTGGFPAAPLNVVHAATLDPADLHAYKRQQFARWRCNWEPGTHFEYHPLAGHWVLGELIEAVSGVDASTYINERVLDPNGLTTLRLGPAAVDAGHMNTIVVRGEPPTADELEAAIGIRIDIGALVGEVTADALVAFNDPAIRALGAPGGGAVGTAADLALYYQALLHDPAGIWPPERLEWATEVRCDLPDPLRRYPAHRSLGFYVAGDAPDALLRGFGHGQGPRTFGHAGAGGQVAWADPDTGLSFAYLTNGLDQDFIREARRKIAVSTRAVASLAA
jgi:CubicO group peptidase (beta-lactamase class C family)